MYSSLSCANFHRTVQSNGKVAKVVTEKMMWYFLLIYLVLLQIQIISSNEIANIGSTLPLSTAVEENPSNLCPSVASTKFVPTLRRKALDVFTPSQSMPSALPPEISKLPTLDDDGPGLFYFSLMLSICNDYFLFIIF